MYRKSKSWASAKSPLLRNPTKDTQYMCELDTSSTVVQTSTMYISIKDILGILAELIT